MKKVIFLLMAVSVFLFIACNKTDHRKETEKILKVWMGKIIQFPADIRPTVFCNDTLRQIPETPYKILLYTDSVGCTSCKLSLVVWKLFIKEVEASMPDKLSFLFYFHPKSQDELRFIFKHDRFDYPVFIDKKNEIGKLNKFSNKIEYQCFLLDKDNRVVLVGNPTLNSQIWHLFKQIVKEK